MPCFLWPIITFVDRKPCLPDPAVLSGAGVLLLKMNGNRNQRVLLSEQILSHSRQNSIVDHAVFARWPIILRYGIHMVNPLRENSNAIAAIALTMVLVCRSELIS